jgi:hypothetical protein
VEVYVSRAIADHTAGTYRVYYCIALLVQKYKYCTFLARAIADHTPGTYRVYYCIAFLVQKYKYCSFWLEQSQTILLALTGRTTFVLVKQVKCFCSSQEFD